MVCLVFIIFLGGGRGGGGHSYFNYFEYLKYAIQIFTRGFDNYFFTFYLKIVFSDLIYSNERSLLCFRLYKQYSLTVINLDVIYLPTNKKLTKVCV